MIMNTQTQINKVQKILLTAVVITLLAGCTTSHPNDVAPKFIPSSQYSDKSCDELERVFETVNTRYNHLWAEQRENKDDEMFWLIATGFIGMGINAEASEETVESLSLVKGEREAIIQEAFAKECEVIIRKAAAVVR